MSLPLFDDLVREAFTNSQLAELEFFQAECKGCIGTQLQKKRKCALLKGYLRVGCRTMDSFVKSKNTKINEKIKKEALLALGDYASFCKERRELRSKKGTCIHGGKDETN